MKILAYCTNSRGEQYPIILDELMPKDHPSLQRTIVPGSIVPIPEEFEHLPLEQLAMLAKAGFNREPIVLATVFTPVSGKPVEPVTGTRTVVLPFNEETKKIMSLATGAMKLAIMRVEIIQSHFPSDHRDLVDELENFKVSLVECVEIIEEQL